MLQEDPMMTSYGSSAWSSEGDDLSGVKELDVEAFKTGSVVRQEVCSSC